LQINSHARSADSQTMLRRFGHEMIAESAGSPALQAEN